MKENIDGFVIEGANTEGVKDIKVFVKQQIEALELQFDSSMICIKPQSEGRWN